MDLTKYFVDNDEDIVISGISGRFPESDTIDELRENLFSNKDLVTEDDRRWPPGLFGLPTRMGKLRELNRFDANYFGLSEKQCNQTDPQGRILLEVTYEAIIDSGWNPKEFRGKRIAVYIGVITTEARGSLIPEPNKVPSYCLIGNLGTMISNRVSFAFDLRGPSVSMDTACSSSLTAFQMAYSGIRANDFDTAIVGGVRVNLNPSFSVGLQSLSVLSMDGKCKYLDSSADGYVRSEAVSVIVLQKRKTARRIYATLINVKTNSDGNKKEGITYPSSQSQTDLIEDILKESEIDPHWVKYVEAHGTGTPVGDLNESTSIYRAYCKNRPDALLVGSVKSNLGHTEPASGMCSIAKVVIAFENHKMPASLHLKHPNPAIKPLIDGSIKVVTKNVDFEDCVVGINSFGLGGTNVHVLLRPHQTLVNEKEVLQIEIPRLILFSGRTEESVQHVFDFIVENPEKVTIDFLSLLNDITIGYESNKMDFRGFMVRDVKENFIEHKISKNGDKRQIWFIMSGMDCQWTGMGKGLIDLEYFKKSILQSAKILEPYGIDLIELILSDKKILLDSILNSTVAIVAIQIALVDIFLALDINPDGFFGHSCEVCCGYIDKALNARQCLLITYWRGKYLEEIKLPKELLTFNYGNEFVTKEYANKQIDPLLQQIYENLKTLGVEKCLRTKRWISTSVPRSEWSTSLGKYSDTKYYTNYPMSPALFQKAIEMIPKNAIVIEISPDSFFQNIIRQCVGPECLYVALMRRNNPDHNLTNLLSAIGNLFNLGLNPRIDNLYPKFQYPVKRGTQSLGSLIKWNHQVDWFVPLYPNYFSLNSKS